ncbi:ATP-binding protein [Streptomyces fradiae]|uniref:ATP-binding protein n=1 Tax=Streptomyces fradiae TaxID=1906 RepID=UPI003987EBE6
MTLVCDASPGLLRVEVTDARGDRWPQARPASALSALSDASLHTSGRGLALVAAVADHWETLPYSPAADRAGGTGQSVLKERPAPTSHLTRWAMTSPGAPHPDSIRTRNTAVSNAREDGGWGGHARRSPVTAEAALRRRTRWAALPHSARPPAFAILRLAIRTPRMLLS